MHVCVYVFVHVHDSHKGAKLEREMPKVQRLHFAPDTAKLALFHCQSNGEGEEKGNVATHSAVN